MHAPKNRLEAPTTREDIAARLGVRSDWLPALEHATRIHEAVAVGMAYIEHRGHRKAPLLIFNDGGAMELPSVRWLETERGARLASVTDEHSSEQTTHYDVCGTVDTILDAVKHNKDLLPLLPLLDDIQSMIERMHRRRTEYEQFREQADSILNRAVRDKGLEPAYVWLDELRDRFSDDRVGGEAGGDSAAIVETIEAVRDIAQFLEYSLSDYRKMAVEILTLIETVRGGRDWSFIRSE